jgi:cobalt/nickel transport system permease protein
MDESITHCSGVTQYKNRVTANLPAEGIMHIPDGFLDVKTAASAAVISAAGVALAVRQVRKTLPPRKVPLLGLSAAFIFAAQMLNFPVAGGTSGHLIGGVLASVLLGPSAAVLVIACVLIVQCLMFADGGLLALGANVFNMALVSTGGGYLVFRILKGASRMEPKRSTIFAAAFAGWVGTVMASVSCAGQLALSGTVPWAMAFPAMANVHMLIGIGEGLITALVLMVVMQARPELIVRNACTGDGGRLWFAAYGLLISLGMAVFVAPVACRWPDGLEKVADLLGFSAKARQPIFSPPIPDYHMPLIGSATVATAVAGVIGTVIAFGAAYCLARLLVPAINTRDKDAPTGQ